MKEKFGEKLEVKLFTLDSEEGRKHTFSSSTNVLFQDEWVPLDMATDSGKMATFLSEKIS